MSSDKKALIMALLWSQAIELSPVLLDEHSPFIPRIKEPKPPKVVDEVRMAKAEEKRQRKMARNRK